jgi:hypothetical protein
VRWRLNICGPSVYDLLDVTFLASTIFGSWVFENFAPLYIHTHTHTHAHSKTMQYARRLLLVTISRSHELCIIIQLLTYLLTYSMEQSPS